MKYPTEKQKKAVIKYIEQGGNFSIYGKDGIYEKLESKLKKLYGINYCLLTNTGTSALSSAYFGLGLKQGDEVIVPVYTFIATVTPLLRLGCVPVFADCDNDGCIDTKTLEKLVTKKTKAIVVTHMWGIPNDMKKVKLFCKKHNLKLVEDCSHAHFTKFKGKLTGTFGDVSAFSVGAKKILSGGEGGFILTNNEEIYTRATLLGHFVMRAEETIEEASNEMKKKYGKLTSGFGENYRMHPYSTVMIYELLKELPQILKHRYKVYSYFREQLITKTKVTIPPVFYGAMYGFKPQTENADKLIELAKKNGLKLKYPDTTPLYNDKVFKDAKFPLRYDGAKAYMKNRLSVPDFITGNWKIDKKIVDKYIDIFRYKENVACVIVNESKEILLLKRSKNEKTMPNIWELPSGGIDNSETLLMALKREVVEETGIIIQSAKMVDTEEYILRSGVFRKETTFRINVKDQEIKLSEEHDCYAWVDRKNLLKYLKRKDDLIYKRIERIGGK